MVSKDKQKGIREMLESGRCPSKTCSSQDIKKEDDDDFEIWDDIEYEPIEEQYADGLCAKDGS